MARARLYEREALQSKRLLALLETSRAVAAALDPAEVLEGARVQLAELLGVAPGDVTVAVRAPDGHFVSPAEVDTAWEKAAEPGGAVLGAATLEGLSPVAADAVTQLQVVGTAGPFRVTSPNSAGTLSTTHTVTTTTRT